MRIHGLLSSVKYIEAAVRLKSFELAAEELHVTSSAVSQQIAKVEQQLDVRLFNRTTRMVEPTAAAIDLAESLAQGLMLMDDALNKICSERAQGPVRLTIYQTWATRWLIPSLGRFYHAWPDVSVEFETGMQEVDFNRADTDFAIRQLDTDRPNLRVTPLFEPSYIPVCAPELAGRISSVEDLASVTLIASQNRLRDWPLWLSVCAPQLIHLQPKLKFSNSTLAYQAAIAGAGVVIGQSHLLNSDIARGALRPLFGTAVAGRVSLSLVEPSDRKLRPAAKAFREWIISEAERFRETPNWIERVFPAPASLR